MTDSERINVLRIVDAAANRASEGLRVIEDYVRFALDDAFLAKECKSIRHELRIALGSVVLSDRLAARESQQDVGANLVAGGEMQRGDALDVASASFSRAQQAIRSLEEYVKLFDARAPHDLQKLRYRLYTLQRAVASTNEVASGLADARLYVLLSGGESTKEFESLVERLVDAGVGAIQLRDKTATDRSIVELARLLVARTKPRGVLSIINDRPDIAALSHADGVHVGQDELSVKDARAIVGPRALVGVSTHSIEQARQAVLDGANYIGVGPTFPSGTKKFDSFPGLDLVRQVAAEISLPAFAIGGITIDNAPLVLAAGAKRIAVSGAIERADDPTATTKRLLAVIA